MKGIEQNAQTLVNLGFEKGREAERQRLIKMIEGLRVDPPTRSKDMFVYELKKSWLWEVRESLLNAFEKTPI